MKISLSEDHVYTVDDKVYPGVTTIIGDVYGRYPYPEGAAERGHHVHLATQLFDEDDLDESSLDETVKGYLEGWKLFRDETGFTPTQIEMYVFNQTYGYCGTLDRLGTIQGRIILLDIKSGVKEWHHPLQTAGYGLCLAPDTIYKRACLYLTANGKYHLQYHINRQDYHDFICTHRCYQIKKENNL